MRKLFVYKENRLWLLSLKIIATITAWISFAPITIVPIQRIFERSFNLEYFQSLAAGGIAVLLFFYLIVEIVFYRISKFYKKGTSHIS